MVFDRVHRLGGARAKKPRPIVVKFQNFTDRDKIRLRSYDETTKQLFKVNKQGVGIQSPQVYRDARKACTEYIGKENLDKDSTRIVGNKLYENNKISKWFIGGKICDYGVQEGQKDIRILSWNIHGLARKINDPDFINIVTDYDLVFLSETWLSKSVSLNLDLNGYESIHVYGNKTRNVRKGRYSGGITVYYRHELNNCITVLEKNQNGIIWLELCKDLFNFAENVYLCCTYIPPSNSTVIDSGNFDFFVEIESGIDKYKSKGKIFVFGDLNCRTSNVNEILDYDPYIDRDTYQTGQTYFTCFS